MEKEIIKIELTIPEAHLFREFQRRHEPIAYLVGYMDTLGIFDMRNMNVTLDFDDAGVIKHSSFTRHIRK